MQPDRTEELSALLERRILVLDGAMGTTIQGYRLSESDFRGQRFASSVRELKGNNDLVSLTRMVMSRAVSRLCSPMEGSSSTYSAPTSREPSDVAS